jgi:hypothetical protein
MARGGHRYHLLLYSYTLNRWWKPAFWIGLFLVALSAGLIFLPVFLPQYHFSTVPETFLWIGAAAGVLSIFLAILLLVIRKSAYIRPLSTHLHLATPLLKMNISYKRIRQASSVEMQRLFPPERYKGWKRKFLQPLAGQTVVLLVMNGWPLSPGVMKMFLSPFFFPDKTSSLALWVPRWMDFSTELESFRGAWLETQRDNPRSPQSDLLASFSKGKR